MTCPSVVNESTILIVESPVTHVALITVKIISINRKSTLPALGKDKRRVPANPIEAKLNKNIKDGFSFFKLLKIFE